MRNSLAALVVAGSLVGAGVGVRAEIIDRILAVVNGAIIMQSDVAVAIRLGLVPSAGAPDPASAALDRHVADIRSRAGAQFDAILLQGGIAVDQLRRDVRDTLRIEAYLQQRFGATQPTDEEILQYYRDHPAAFSQNGAVRPFEDVRDVARAALIEERRGATIRDWIAGLRRRASVSVLPR